MSDQLELLARARRCDPADQALRGCWSLVVRGMEAGWLDRDEMLDLLQHLRDHRDFGIEELTFSHLGEHLRVSFLDDRATCSPSEMIAMLEALLIGR